MKQITWTNVSNYIISIINSHDIQLWWDIKGEGHGVSLKNENLSCIIVNTVIIYFN